MFFSLHAGGRATFSTGAVQSNRNGSQEILVQAGSNYSAWRAGKALQVQEMGPRVGKICYALTSLAIPFGGESASVPV